MLFHVSSKLFVLSNTVTVLVRNLVSTFVQSKAFGCCARRATYFKQSTSKHVRALQLRMVVLLSLAYVVRFASLFVVHWYEEIAWQPLPCVSFSSSRNNATSSLASTSLDPFRFAACDGDWFAFLRTPSLSSHLVTRVTTGALFHHSNPHESGRPQDVTDRNLPVQSSKMDANDGDVGRTRRSNVPTCRVRAHVRAAASGGTARLRRV